MENNNLNSIFGINGKFISLIPINTSDYHTIYQMHCNLGQKYLWNDDCTLYDFDSFCQNFTKALHGRIHTYLLIKDSTKSNAIGFIYSYNYSVADGLIFITINILPEYQNKLYGAEAGVKFVNYLFKYFPIRKIYFDVFEYNDKSNDLLTSMGFKLEGEFKEHKFYNGNYYSLYRYAVFRKEFYKTIGGLF